MATTGFVVLLAGSVLFLGAVKTKKIIADEILLYQDGIRRTLIAPGYIEMLDERGHVGVSIVSIGGGSILVAAHEDATTLPVASVRINASARSGARVELLDADEGGKIALIHSEGRGVTFLTSATDPSKEQE